MKVIDFNQPYDQKVFLDFLQQVFLPEDFSPADEVLDLEFKPRYIDEVTHLGECPELGLNVYKIHHGSENDPRVSLTKETFRLMKEYNDFNALAVFISPGSENYRLSYVTIGLKSEDKKPTYEYPNPRRYSYFLGPDAKVITPTRFLLKRGRVADMNELQERFSIEVVNKEFYREIATLFTKLVGGTRKEGSKTKEFESILRLPSVTDHQKMQEFAVRMIGRIVFCWFLKKKTTSDGKPLIPVDILSLDAVKGNDNYYHTILEKLFFQVLNTPQENRRDEFKSGSFADIPFLNGGLFEPHKDDKYKLNDFSGTSWSDNDLVVPDEWLRELFELLERYNFTIDENTSMDVELSVDPEMLGRIFENLLAEINPETGETARKDTGSYYTPRPIVEYMVDESLKQYLLTKTGIQEDKLQRLLSFSQDVENLSQEESRKIIDALDAVKIIDPACGSGAFPMGILQKMVLVLQKADPDLLIWKNKQLEGISSSFVRSTVEERMKNEDWNYIRKMDIIQKAIYGVDIQQIAVEISKLRVFLSLVVDSKVIDTKPNQGIESLPNLEFKFVCANTLVGLSKGNGIMFEAHQEIKELKSLREDYFKSFGNEKHRIEKKFRETQDKMFHHAYQMGVFGGQTLTLSEWDPFSEKSADWFDPEWMFGIKEGFDIVIANPPYVRQEKIPVEYKKILKLSHPSVANSMADLYVYFFSVALNLLNEKATMVFITLNKWLKTKYGKELRDKLRTKIVDVIIDFFELPVFSASTDTAITKVVNYPNDSNETMYFPVKSLKNLVLKDLIKGQHKTVIKDPTGWLFINKYEENILRKIYSNSIPLNEFVKNKIHYGVKTGANKIFVVNNTTKEKLCSKDKKSTEILKPFLKSTSFSKYSANWGYEWLILTRQGVNIEKYKAIKEYLEKYKEVLEPKPINWKGPWKGRKSGSYKWYEIQDNVAYYREFEEPKIIYIYTAKDHQFYLDYKGYYVNNSCYIIVSDNKYLFYFLNSILFNWFQKIKFVAYGDSEDGGRVKLDNNKMINVPIKKIDSKVLNAFESIYNLVLNERKRDKVVEYERKIDNMLYELFDLTPEEVAIVEGETK